MTSIEWEVFDRRDGERVRGNFETLEAAEAWIEKTDRRGSGEFEARETDLRLDPESGLYRSDWA